MTPQRFSRYQVLEELGRGSMGVVYKARDPIIDRIVAIKTISMEAPGSETDGWRHRFYREAKSAGRLNHPNIVTIYDVGESDNVAYIAMEFLAGQSLRDILDSGTVLPPALIASIVAQVADGLAFAHEHGVVHRDIKPANIMVLESGAVKIMDFGIARLPSGTQTVAGTFFGSPKYISPERLQGLAVDGRSDIFSLGAVLYEMLTDFPPFFGGDLNTIMTQVLDVMPAPPSTRNRKVPVAFDHIIATAMAKRPEDRYADATAMAFDLRNFADLKIPASEASAPSPSTKPIEAQAPHNSFSVRLGANGDAGPGELVPAAWRNRASAMVRDPRLPARAVAGVAIVVLVALAAWSMLSPRPSERPPPLASVAGANGSPAASAIVPPVPVAPAAVTSPLAGGEREVQKSVAKAVAAAPTPQVIEKPAAAVVEKRAAAVVEKPAAAVVGKPLPRVMLAVTPWGEVYVNGKKVGVSPPMVELKLAPGKYDVEIRNSTFEPYRENIDLRSSAN
ncbi:MAG: serine/threonine-protein kinase, partial [Betaproteobacteria bacterium]